MDNIEQKARSLADMFLDCMPTFMYKGDNLSLPIAKQCAVICVDEIIGSHKSKSPNYEKETYWHPIDYWQQVKEKIQSL